MTSKAKMDQKTIALLKQYYDEGASMDSIALSLGMTKSGVCGALHRHYPDRVKRNYRVPEQSFDDFKALLDDYAAGQPFAYLVEKYGIPERAITRRIYAYSKLHPKHYEEMKKRRAPMIEARRRAVMLQNNPRKKPPVWLAVSNGNDRIWTALDEAIRTLQKYAPCYRDPEGRGIVYGTRLKTEDEILAMAERKAA